jgi:hypothetical protein
MAEKSNEFNSKMEKITEKTAVKENAIRLANHHIQHCNGETCNISLYLLRRLIEMAGIELTENEKRKFI